MFDQLRLQSWLNLNQQHRPHPTKVPTVVCYFTRKNGALFNVA